jgi:hypothetical protein
LLHDGVDKKAVAGRILGPAGAHDVEVGPIVDNHSLELTVVLDWDPLIEWVVSDVTVPPLFATVLPIPIEVSSESELDSVVVSVSEYKPAFDQRCQNRARSRQRGRNVGSSLGQPAARFCQTKRWK